MIDHDRVNQLIDYQIPILIDFLIFLAQLKCPKQCDRTQPELQV